MATSNGEAGAHPAFHPEPDCRASGPTFDASRLRTEFKDASLLRGLVLELLSELPTHIRLLREALDEERFEGLATHARRLAQLLTSLLAFPAAEAALRLRYAAEVASPDAAGALAGLEGALGPLVSELAEHFDLAL